jgi:hypothetical protein
MITMPAASQRSRNLLLGSLSADDFGSLLPGLKRVPLKADEVILKANAAI